MSSRFVFVSSTSDPASNKMAMYLINNFGFEGTSNSFEENPIFQKKNIILIRTSSELLYLKEPNFKTNCYIFLSRHKSESGIPTLTAHFPGNFSNETSYGGNPYEIGYSYPSLHKLYLQSLKQLQDQVPQYKIVTEPTHHGPTSFSKPVLFIEIGSTEKEWNDHIAVEVACKALMKAVNSTYVNAKYSIGFGGTHYSEKITNLIIDSEYALGAIIPKYALKSLNIRIVEQMIEKSVEKILYGIIDWKGVKDRKRIISLIEKVGIKILRI
jgi:D-aminoacyl-tRNA deacylase